MAITEEVRHRIYETFRSSFGDEVANGLMELLPPVGWADVATKQDVASLRQHMDLRFELLEQRFELLEQRFELLEQRFEFVDGQVDLLEARMGERLERALRIQSARFMATMASMFVAFGLIDRLYPA